MRTWREYSVKYNCRSYVCIQAICIAVIILGERFWLDKYASNCCIMDGIRLLMNGSVFLVLYILQCLYVSFMIKGGLHIQRAIRMKARRKLWMDQARSICLINAVTSAIWMITGAIVGRSYTSTVQNWSVSGSFFSYTTDPVGQTSRMSVLPACIVLYLIIMLTLDVIFLLILASNWIGGSVILGMLLIIATGFYDTWEAKQPLFLKQFLVYGNEWTDRAILFQNIICLLILNICLIVAGMLLADRKEFLDGREERK